jgi:hypothetical protein
LELDHQLGFDHLAGQIFGGSRYDLRALGDATF